MQKYQAHPHDIVFSGIARQQDHVFIVQIGAADGKRADPIYPFVRRYGWNGLLVEPLNDLYQLLQQNYAGQAGLVFERAAITEKAETRTMSRVPLEMVGKDDVPRWAFGAASLVPERTVFSPDHSSDALHETLSKAAVSEQVSCMSLAELIEKHKVTDMDVLQIDTEGYDAKILGQLDFDRFRPTVINMEWQWLTDSEKEFVTKRLGEHGYSLNICGEDLLATTRPVESFIAFAEKPLPESVPVFFPNVIGLVSNTDVDMDNGSCAPYAAQIDIIRSPRGNSLALRGNARLCAFLAAIDGKRTYSQIADLTGYTTEDLFAIVENLGNLYVVE